VNEYFDTGHHAYMEMRSDDFARFVMDRVWLSELEKYNTCIELGAGTGRFTPPLIERFDQVHLIEPAPAYAKALDARFASENVTVSDDSAEQFLDEWPEEEPVLLTAFHLLHHLTFEQRQHIYAFLKRTQSRGVFVEPNPWNPLILAQVLLTPGMSFAEEKQYLQLRRARLAAELSAASLEMKYYRRIVALPPGITDALLHRGVTGLLSACEALTAIPCASSYHSFHVVPSEGTQ